MEIAPVKNRGLQNTSVIRYRWVVLLKAHYILLPFEQLLEFQAMQINK